MSFQGILDWIWRLHHDDEEYEGWGGIYEILFWVVVLALQLGLVLYAAWSLAVKHTEATGCSVLVEVEPHEASSSPSGDSSLSGGTTRKRNNRGLSFLRST